MKHILFISYDGMTDPLGQSQVIPYLSGLCKEGYRFTLLSCDKPAVYRERKSIVDASLANLPIRWISLPYHKFPPVLSSIYDYRQLLKTAILVHREEPIDMVHTRPGIPTLVAVVLKKKYGIKFLNDIRGFWADERVDGGMWNRKNPIFNRIYRYFKHHEDECLEIADYNTCLTQAAKKEILSWKHVKRKTDMLDVIPCSADLQLFDPSKISATEKEKLREKFGIQPGEIIVSYLGSIGGWYLVEEMMRFCRRLSDKIPQVKFLFITPHRQEQVLAAAARYELPTGKLVTTTASRKEIPALLSLSNFSVFFIKPCYSKISSSPTKHGEIMAMGIPVITNSGVGDVKEIVEKYAAGFILDDFSEKSFDRVVNAIVSKQAFNPAAIREGAMAIYDLDKALQVYAKAYRSVLGH